MPATRPDFWAGKFAANQRRDAAAEAALRQEGWDVMTVWECETRDPARLAELAAEIKSLPSIRLRT
jgi:DNA mismatch endonuclease (patch repair protein)